ncbi:MULTISPECIES: RNA polymerase sigma factor WhiG [Saccharopolyspora]|uniref:RNA polymerase sigma factor n=1 Tax=Saccharopolyspora gregorii TaxID=33914 RepID=A0ABP6RQ27_9PSEU|nr:MULTISPECIES: RNA polymerase sigma factor WhiG [unclassified Saccharopolyspora]MCA1187514.1 RNA polymerase sigma factor WhiG [Saccharopolyspora sp. 6T]MCA1195952.1 RNA polymerase sigma factor WhiG [Saccharopolyspora sp. 6V]MCA1228193.1 RNA polymerase sigma factor WhiG [Saccharopolyspora sp. 6M]MCA1280569.1 RNA polymerase sigma factor WhiG [Saccharopolyspora sp. 7B]
MTEPTPVPDDAGGGARTVATEATSRSTSSRANLPGEPTAQRSRNGRGTSSATNGAKVNGSRQPEGAAASERAAAQPERATRSRGDQEADAAKPPVSARLPYLVPDDQRSADEVEAGIVALWQAFGEHRDQGLRDRLVLHYAPLVKYVAGRVGTGLPSHVEVSDLVQSGIFGLVDAIEKFEPERGLKFETYAMQRIRGAILDDLRAQDWVPRSVRSRARDLERALERLEAKLQRHATDVELADELDVSADELHELFAQLQMTSVVALDDLISVGWGGTASLAETLPDDRAEDPVAALVDRDSRRQLAEAVERLSDRDRVVVTLYYFENLTLAEIGKVLGVTESRVCQLHTRAVLRLRSKLTEPQG